MPMKPVVLALIAPLLTGMFPLAAAGTLADPTRPGNAALFSANRDYGPANNAWVLNSTLVGAERRVAVINGKHVSEGESIDNATVLQIGKLDVLIMSAGKRITLKLLPDIVNNQP